MKEAGGRRRTGRRREGGNMANLHREQPAVPPHCHARTQPIGKELWSAQRTHAPGLDGAAAHPAVGAHEQHEEEEELGGSWSEFMRSVTSVYFSK